MLYLLIQTEKKISRFFEFSSRMQNASRYRCFKAFFKQKRDLGSSEGQPFLNIVKAFLISNVKFIKKIKIFSIFMRFNNFEIFFEMARLFPKRLTSIEKVHIFKILLSKDLPKLTSRRLLLRPILFRLIKTKACEQICLSSGNT